MKRKREQDEFIDQAIEQAPPAPQPVSVPPQAQAATVPIDPLTPPQPGMVPIGWMWPQQSAVAQAMDTGDVEMAGLAPDGSAIEPAEDMGLGEDEDMYTDEEKKVIEEYRKWKKNSIKEKKLKEDEEDLEMDPIMPDNVTLAEPPIEGEDLGDLDVPIEGEDLDAPIEDDFMDELGEIVIDINDLFEDLGGDIESFMPEDEVVEDDLDLPIDEVDDVVEEDVVVEEEPLEEKKTTPKASRKKEEIKYPAGDPQRKDVDDPTEFIRTKEAMERRRELVQKLRRRREMDAQKIAADATQDPDEADKEIGYDSVQSVIDKIGESRIKQFKQQEAYDKKFLERYEEKKQLNWKKLLENGLLG